jgi:hypothetical protein
MVLVALSLAVDDGLDGRTEPIPKRRAKGPTRARSSTVLGAMVWPSIACASGLSTGSALAVGQWHAREVLTSDITLTACSPAGADVAHQVGEAGAGVHASIASDVAGVGLRWGPTPHARRGDGF